MPVATRSEGDEGLAGFLWLLSPLPAVPFAWVGASIAVPDDPPGPWWASLLVVAAVLFSVGSLAVGVARARTEGVNGWHLSSFSVPILLGAIASLLSIGALAAIVEAGAL